MYKRCRAASICRSTPTPFIGMAVPRSLTSLKLRLTRIAGSTLTASGETSATTYCAVPRGTVERGSKLMVSVAGARPERWRSEEHTSELQSRQYLVCRLLLEKKKKKPIQYKSNK